MIKKGHVWTPEQIAKRAEKRAGGPWPDRFMKFVSPEPNSGCWLWDGSCNPQGYGQLSNGTGKVCLATRISWALHRGPIPDGMKVLHKCDTPACVNPDHLRLGTMRDNTRDMLAKGRGSNGVRYLTVQQVHEMREDRLKHKTHARVLAARYGITDLHVYRILSGKSWGWI